MDKELWLVERQKKSTLSGVARRMFESGKGYEGFEKAIRERYVLEAVISEGGNQSKAAEKIGVHRHTVGRIVRSMGLTDADILHLSGELKVKQ